jgi:hypothetical protein
MTTKHTDQAGACPLTTVLKLATDTATSTLGTDATNKSVSTKASLTTSVTENQTTNTQAVDASVTLGVTTSSAKVADATK